MLLSFAPRFLFSSFFLALYKVVYASAVGPASTSLSICKVPLLVLRFALLFELVVMSDTSIFLALRKSVRCLIFTLIHFSSPFRSFVLVLSRTLIFLLIRFLNLKMLFQLISFLITLRSSAR